MSNKIIKCVNHRSRNANIIDVKNGYNNPICYQCADNIFIQRVLATTDYESEGLVKGYDENIRQSDMESHE